MTLFDLVGFGAAMFILAITPGPGVFATVGQALAAGFNRAALMVCGQVMGDLVFLLLAIFGLAALAEILGSLFHLVRIVGGLYLCWLGWRAWHAKDEPPTVTTQRRRASGDLLSGLMITLGNPKVILFYLGFLPTFVDLQHIGTTDIVLLAFTVILVLGTVMLTYAYTAARSRRLFTSRRARRTLNRCSGTVMMATGTVLLARN
jgi:threonine/homoserine/homoserine lactone efflux protein